MKNTPNFRDYQTLVINGQELNGKEISDYCRASSEQNVQELGTFISEWLNDNPKMEVTTSGSTGTPKVIRIAKEKMLQSAAMTAAYFGFEAGQKALLCLPMQYIAGKMMVIRALFSKLDLVCIEPSGNPLVNLPKDMVIDFAPLVPLQLEKSASTSNIRKILLGGAPVSHSLEEKIQNLNSEVYLSYGMTETLTHVAIRKLNGPDQTDYFEGLKGITFQSDPQACLVINVPFLDHPVITHDIVELLNDSSFRWRGRTDNVINSGGIKIHPEEIEQKLHPFIQGSFFVAGMSDRRLGQKLCLFIQGKKSEETTAVLSKNIQYALAKYEKPKEIYYMREFSYTPSGKIQRKETVRNFSNRGR